MTDNDRTKFWCVADLDDLEVLHARNIVRSSSRHTHETLTLGIIERGTATLNHKGESHAIGLGSIVAINPDDVHACYTQNFGGYDQHLIYPSIQLLERANSEITGRSPQIPFFQNPILENKKLFRQLEELFGVLENPSSAIEQETYLIQTLTLLIGVLTAPTIGIKEHGNEPQVVRLIRDYLEANYRENPSLSQLAMLTHFSPFHLSRVFCQAVGLPPHLYLIQVRVLKAKKLLSQGLAIAQVAQDVGFAHQSHLYRHFKKFVGITPKQYQRQFQ
ncbi:AraC family transcriptional regulator [Pseudanabaena sp. UWO310]|uniref:AraC family transcriptional regulator n=1 Tax=Pseudanabaena sp. UWO310 TaxID=2480795 RepID=UPI0011610596|nr:AraC family transcriptional regulator [Pseudanabaena sp. UWO310]TYQ23945.1 AraC family transcriptional regulator [Pseudanabaena sp. UWO310]